MFLLCSVCVELQQPLPVALVTGSFAVSQNLCQCGTDKLSSLMVTCCMAEPHNVSRTSFPLCCIDQPGMAVPTARLTCVVVAVVVVGGGAAAAAAEVFTGGQVRQSRLCCTLVGHGCCRKCIWRLSTMTSRHQVWQAATAATACLLSLKTARTHMRARRSWGMP